MRKSALVIISLLVLSACNNSSDNHTTNKIANKYFFYPDSLSTICDSNTVHVPISNIIDTSQKTLVAIIWGDCHVCMKKINQWAAFIEEHHLQDFQTLMVVTTQSPQYFIRIFKPELIYTGALAVDTQNSFYELNSLTNADIDLHTFLIGSDRQIVLAGDPFIYPELAAKYIEEMSTCHE